MLANFAMSRYRQIFMARRHGQAGAGGGVCRLKAVVACLRDGYELEFREAVAKFFAPCRADHVEGRSGAL